jgi:hypothetical protein
MMALFFLRKDLIKKQENSVQITARSNRNKGKSTRTQKFAQSTLSFQKRSQSDPQLAPRNLGDGAAAVPLAVGKKSPPHLVEGRRSCPPLEDGSERR